MYAIERIRIIKQYLEKHGQAQVQALSSLLSVSEVTVRRDLERLEAEGWLTRTHGGAIINRPEPVGLMGDLPTTAKEREIDEEAYQGIAFVALQMIADGDVIMLTGGRANRFIASRLSEKSGLTVLTNDIRIAAAMAGQNSNKTVFLGGTLDKEELTMYGSLTVMNLEKFYVNLLFSEVDGISRDLQLTVKSQEKADFFAKAKKVANRNIVICPADRSDSNAFYRLGDIHFADKLISTSDLSEEYKTSVFNNGIPLYTPMEAYEGSR